MSDTDDLIRRSQDREFDLLAMLDKAKERIAALEAERDKWQKLATEWGAECDRVVAERDRLRMLINQHHVKAYSGGPEGPIVFCAALAGEEKP